MNIAAEYAVEWWNLYSSLKERYALCHHLKWHKGHAEGEASLEWLCQDEVDQLKKVSYDILIEIEKGQVV